MTLNLKSQLVPWALVTAVNVYVLGNFIIKEAVWHGVGYFVFFYAAVFAIYVLASRLSITNDIPVRRPRQELLIALGFTLIGIVALFLNFYIRMSGKEYSFLIRLTIIAGVFLFTFPIALALYFLLRRYKLWELGLSIRPWQKILIGLAVWAITGVFAMAFHYEGLLWELAYKELGGIPGLIIQGIIGAALVEEFIRFILQTRLNVFLKNSVISILCVSFVWSFMHFPSAYHKSSDLISTTNYCIQIIPLGFVWGYLIHITRSMIPSIIAHGLNLWGFQNG